MENKNVEKLVYLCKASELSELELISNNRRPAQQYSDGENVTNCQSAVDSSDTQDDTLDDIGGDYLKRMSSEPENTGFCDGTGIQARPSGKKPLWKLADDSRTNSIMSIRKDYEVVIRKVEDMISAAEERGMFRISLTTKDGMPVRLLGNTLKDYFTCMGYKCKFLMYDDVLNNSELFISWLN